MESGYAQDHARVKWEETEAKCTRDLVLARMATVASERHCQGDVDGAALLRTRIADIMSGDMPGKLEFPHVAHAMGGRMTVVALGLDHVEEPQSHGVGADAMTVGWLQSTAGNDSAGHFVLVSSSTQARRRVTVKGSKA